MTLIIKPHLVPELSCSDIQIRKDFYINVLGFAVLYERISQKLCYLKRHGVEIMIKQISATTWKSDEMRKPFGRGMHFQIQIDDVEDLYKNCLSAKVSIFREMEDTWYRADQYYFGQRQFIILDPDGFMLRFAENLGTMQEPPKMGRIVA